MTDRLDGVLGALTQRAVPGLSMAIVAGGRDVEHRAAGLADLADGRPAGPDTGYLWFSMTKIVTATAVMQLVERGSLALDDPVREFLPEFPQARAGRPQVTVRHLLSHSSGLGNPLPVRWVHPAGQPGRDPREFTLEVLERHGRLRFRAGTTASYSNLGYLALGEVIAAAGRRPYAEHVRRSILAPLGMTRTDFAYRPDMAADAATGYQSLRSPMTPALRLLLPRGIVDGRQGRYVRFHRFCVDGAAYGGLIGSARDAARFVAMHLDQGRANGAEILSPESVQAMQTTQVSGRKLDVGLGWYRRRADPSGGARYVEHLGGGGGFFTAMRVYPDRRAGIIVMGNATSYDQHAVMGAAVGM